MDYRNFLQMSLVSKQMKANPFGSLNLNDNKFTDAYKEVSLFDSANLEDIQNLDWESILNNINPENLANFENLNPEQLDINGEANGLTNIVQSLMEIKDVQTAIDADGDGVITEDEASAFIKNIMSADGDGTTLTYADIDKALEEMGINLSEVAEESVEQALLETEGLNLDELVAAEEAEPVSAPTQAQQAQQAPRTTGTSSGGGATRSGGSSSTRAASKTSAEELEELEQQRKEIIAEADQNIQAKETEKDEAVAEDKTINSELKTEYQDARTELQETKSNISETEANIQEFSSNIAGLENDIAALQAEQGALSTNTQDENINQQNRERLETIKSSVAQKEKEKEKVEKQKQDAEEKLKELEDKRTTQEENVAQIEAKIAELSPELGQKLQKINGDIQELKTQKTTDVAEIDAKIEKKRAEAKNDAAKAGESKGKAANNLGSGLIEMASKYLGLNEADGSYKMFTNGRAEAWCADFMSYVVKEYAAQQGMELKDGFGSPSVSNVMQWAMNNGIYNDITGMNSAEKENFLETELKPGDIIIWKRNGMSHTGFIKEINEDGTFVTLEGNSSDQVKSNVYNINNNKLSGFIRLSDVFK